MALYRTVNPKDRLPDDKDKMYFVRMSGSMLHERERFHNDVETWLEEVKITEGKIVKRIDIIHK